MKPKNFPGRKNARRIAASKASGIPNPKIVSQDFAESIRTKKFRGLRG